MTPPLMELTTMPVSATDSPLATNGNTPRPSPGANSSAGASGTSAPSAATNKAGTDAEIAGAVVGLVAVLTAVLFGLVYIKRARNEDVSTVISGPAAEFAALVKEQAIAEYHLR